jgi:transcriptional regulator with XRE-family HTH domain
MSTVDDRRLGLILRALRRRRGWRQCDLAEVADLSQSVVSRAEAGHFDTLAVKTVRQLFAAVDARLNFEARWRGGEVDRLIDSHHASIGGAAADVLIDDGWRTLQEVTYAVYRERGSIDLLGVKDEEAIAVAMEIKTEVTSWEETQRKFDEKVRLLSGIVHERLGWRPRVVAAVIVLDDTMTNRRRIASLGPAADHAYPARTREIRRWLRQPSGPLRGIWFLSAIPARGTSDRRGGSHRVRRSRSR